MIKPELADEGRFDDAVFSVVDVETTGSVASGERMIEFAAYKVRNGRIVDEYTTLLNPGRHIPNFIRNMTGISNEMVYDAPSFGEVAGRIYDFLSETIFTAHNSHFDYSFVRNEMAMAGFDFDMPQLCTRKLSSRVFPQLPRKALDHVCRHLGIKISARHRAYGDARATAHLLIELLELIAERHEVVGVDELLRFQNVSASIDRHKNQNVFKNAMMRAPNLPGVYRVHGADGEIVYAGKAKNLKLRLASYLTQNEKDSTKVRKMIQEARGIEFEIAASELAAFMRELQLIRQHQPKFNSLLVNPRRFPFIKLSTESKFDTLDVVYELDGAGRYYGPFENSFIAEQVLLAADKYFKLVKCENDFARPFDPCLYFHIERCMAPCRGDIGISEYEREVEAVEEFLSGSFEKLTSELRLKLDELSKKLEFEEAIEMRDLIEVLEKTSSRLKLLDGPLSRANFVCGWLRENEYELYAVRRGFLTGPKVAADAELESGLKLLLSGSPIAGDFVPLRIILNYALKNPQGFFKIDAKGTESELAQKIKTAVGHVSTAVHK
ncbi:MAG TPA: exonuclease domain-containing protein [Candidatus Acidoferrales bacterium]|nr:exonuclease domain-containing protein [Candidatus Acidoferrales bacterium]